MRPPAKRRLTRLRPLRQNMLPICCALAGALVWPMPCRAATSAATVRVSATVGLYLDVNGEGAAGSAPVMSTALPADGIPFRIRVRSNAPWRWSARVESAAGLSAPLRCAYAYHAVQIFGGVPAGPGQVELGSGDGGVLEALPRGEVMLEGRVLPPLGAHSRVPCDVTLVWTITQLDANVGQPRSWTTTLRLRGSAAAVPVLVR